MRKILRKTLLDILDVFRDREVRIYLIGYCVIMPLVMLLLYKGFTAFQVREVQVWVMVRFDDEVFFEGYVAATTVNQGETCVVGNKTLCVLQGEMPRSACFRNSLNATVVLFALMETGEYPALYEARVLKILIPGASDCILTSHRAILSLAKP